MQAKARSDLLTLQSLFRFDDIWFAECDCNDYDHYKSLPNVIEAQGHVLGKSAWNSERNIAYYRDDKIIAKNFG